MSKDHILNEVIIGYRHVIEQRYQYHLLQKKYKLPDSIDEKIVQELRDYFLNYVYPQIDKRTELNEAFDSLNSHIKNPAKLLGLLIDSFKISFKYGRHLPRILTTGLNAFHSFQAANQFEEKLVEKAIENQIEPPFQLSQIYTLIKLLPRNEIETFIESFKSVFETFHDQVLITKIKEILGYLLAQMHAHPQRYSHAEMRGIQIGLEILTEGNNIFSKLPIEDQQKLIPMIVQIEQDALNEIFSPYE